MSLSVRPEHLKRYKDLAWLLIKYGRFDLLAQAGLDQALGTREKPAEGFSPKVEELPHDLEKLGPTYVKLGQFLSTRSDMLPPQYIEALSRLQDRAEEFPYEKVEEIITQELGLRASRAFSEFDEVPIAAASLAQVHRAVLQDGRHVAVKVQRPDIRGQIVADLDALEDLAEFLDKHTTMGKRYMLQETLGEFRKALLREMDFRQEAQNLNLLGENLRDYDLIVVPSPIEEYTTSRVITMDYIRGTKITSISPLRRLEINGSKLAEELFRAYLQQILIDGFYHADPHPGNVFLTDDGRIALIDLGMVARVSAGVQRSLLSLVLAISDGRSDEAVEYAIELGEKTPAFDERQFKRRVGEMVVRCQRATIKEIQVGRIVIELFKVAGESGIHFPSELAMLGKSLLNLDNIGRTLDPAFDPNAAVRRYGSELFRAKIRKSVSASDMYELLMDSKELLQFLPKRMNKIMADLAGNEFSITLHAFDEKYLMTGFQKIANRLSLGVILASMIIGASLLMHVDTPFKLFGYPGLAVIFLLLAALGGGALAVKIGFHDERCKRNKDGDIL